MTEKRCRDCKHTRGIGFDFWCGEGHTKYEVFIGETNCPYFEYHDWSKGIPSKTEKRKTEKPKTIYKNGLKWNLLPKEVYGKEVYVPCNTLYHYWSLGIRGREND